MGLFAEKISSEDLFFDNHLHFLTMSNICVSAYISYFVNNKFPEAAVIASSADYIYKDLIGDLDRTLAPLSIIEGDERRVIQILQDDFRGKFHEGPSLYSDGKITFGGHSFKKIVLNPLLIDFDYPYAPQKNSYKLVPRHPVDKQAAAIINAIKDYYTTDPNGLFLIRPYVGFHPGNYTFEEVRQFMKRYFSNWSGKAADGLKTVKQITSFKVTENCIYPNFFGGIKFYPPLGFNGASQNRILQEKTDYIFDYCEKNGIPIITHCDDQGFRLLPIEKSLQFTSPENWEQVLKRFPNLYLDFAHFGKQYFRRNPLKAKLPGEWMEKIVELMLRYPNVYTDVSFTGFESNFWGAISTLAYSHSAEEQSVIRRKILFGTDWPLSLLKINTASNYIQRLDDLPLDQDFKYAIVNENPRNFGFRD